MDHGVKEKQLWEKLGMFQNASCSALVHILVIGPVILEFL